MSATKCKLAALGMVNALGRSPEEIRKRMLAGDQSGISKLSNLLQDGEVWVGAVQGSLEEVPERLFKYKSRNTSLLAEASKQISSQVQNYILEHGGERVGVVLGTSTSGIGVGEEAVSQWLGTGELPEGYLYTQQELGATAQFLAELLGISGPAYTVSTACSSSAKVFASGRHLLEMNLCDAVIVGGADSLCKLTVNGFSSLELVSESICKPMSKNREGLTIGEGACLFLMTRESGGVQLLGVGESSDAHHFSAPDAEGRGAETAMRKALEDAGLRPEDIKYINLHGTGTLHNDSMESCAVSRVFSENTPCSSTKPLVGHTLGAAGATEVGFCWLVLGDFLENSVLKLPPHCFDGVLDETLCKIKLVGLDDQVETGKSVSLLSNSFAFGGSNCAVIIGVQG